MTFAEAVQIYCETGRRQWAHTAYQVFYLCEIHRDPKQGKKRAPTDYNPWEYKADLSEKGINISEDFTALERLSTWRGR